MTSKVLLIGSGNRDKAAELQELLADGGWEVRSLTEYPEIPEPVEDADTFEGNALLKARYYGVHFKVPCVADDSGIEVDALNGEPGVYSARYAGESCTYDDNNRKMLAALAEVDAGGRNARFVCCAAFVDVDGKELVTRGEVAGAIAFECRGEHGFGYDPLFVPEGESGTFGELGPGKKRKISHRGKAFRKLCERIERET